MGSLRPVIVIDGTHLKGKARGVLFLAATKDANEQLYLLAYGVGPKENDESWSYFLRRFVEAYGDASPLLVVSDQHKSIANAVKKEMEHATHAYCYYHMQKNLAHYKKGVISRFFEAAYSYDKIFTDTKLRELERKNNKAWRKLMDIGVDKWSRAHCPIRRYSFMTSNAAESMNSKLRWSRHLPICSLLEAVRLVQDEWMSSRRIRAERSTDLLSEEAHKRINKEASEARRHFVRQVSDQVYRVKADDVYVLVDLNRRTCECGVFWIDEFPCSHAYAAIMKAKRSIEEFIAAYYRRETLVDVYSGIVHHLPPRSQWTIPDEIANLTVLPPIVTRQAGRPKLARIPGGMERRTSTSRRRPSSRRYSTSSQPSSSRQTRAPKKCSICRELGHTKNKCALNTYI